MPPTLKTLIVGTGRCGTGYLADALNRSGIACGHESIFNHFDEKRVQGNLARSQLVADSAWPAAIFIGRPWLPAEVRIVHLVRHPLDVITSFWEIDFFSEARIGKTLNQVVYRNTTISPDTQDRLMSAVEHYIQWNRLIGQKLAAAANPAIQLRLEDITRETAARARLGDFLGLKLAFAEGRINEKSDIKARSSQDLRAAILRELQSRDFDTYGYL